MYNVNSGIGKGQYLFPSGFHVDVFQSTEFKAIIFIVHSC